MSVLPILQWSTMPADARRAALRRPAQSDAEQLNASAKRIVDDVRARGGLSCRGQLCLVALQSGRVEPRQPRAFRGGHRRFIERVGLIPRRHVREHVGWPDALVELQRQCQRTVEAVVAPGPADRLHPHGRRDEL